jgi:hypothetical protein
MTSFIIALFFSIGLVASVIWIFSNAFEITMAFKEHRQQRDKEFNKIIAAIDRIESNTRNKPNQG